MRRLVSWVSNLLYPQRCMLCRCFLSKGETDICHRCLCDAPVYPFGRLTPDKQGKNNIHFLDSFTAVWYYEGDVRKSILRYKFRRGVFLAPKFARMLAERLTQQEMAHPDVLTWVPVSRARRFQRGYDQCELLAKQLGKTLGVPVVSTLRKVRNAPPQSGLDSAAMRKANILGAFALKKDIDLNGKIVLLIDDIFTTGSTMNECARVLLTSGAAQVHGATVAVTRNHKKSK